MSLALLIRVLADAGISPTGREIAEAVWLAQHLMPPSEPARSEIPAELPTAARDESNGPEADAPALPAEPASVALSTGTGTGAPVRGHPVGVPGLPGIHLPQEIQRALRPLRRRTPSRHRRVLDEDATASLTADTGLWAPVLRPAQERWFDVVLVVDTSRSMDLWRSVTKDLQAILVRSGAFRNVRVWYLSPDEDGGMVQPGARASSRNPRELVDPAGRRLFFVLTDGAAAGWHDGSATAALAEWTRAAPVAVLQTLPEEMWTRTGLPAVAARLSARGRGTPNRRLRVTSRRRRPEGDVPIAVLGIEAFALNAWACLAMGAVDVPLAITSAGDRPGPRTSAPPASGGSAVDQFRAKASPAAYQLAVSLSVIPLTIPVMRLVQHALFPSSSPAILAEILLGGLIVRTGDNSYDFGSGVRDALFAELRRSEASTVLSVMSQHLGQRAGTTTVTFPAIAESSTGPIATTAETFSWVPAEIAGRLGLSSNGAPGRRGKSVDHSLEVARLIPPRPSVGADFAFEALVAFCLTPTERKVQYLWIQGRAFSGKSALLSHFVVHPPAAVSVVSYFAGVHSRGHMLPALIQQLCVLLDRPVPEDRGTANAAAQLTVLLNIAASYCQSRGRRLVLVIDGLDELGQLADEYARDLAAVLPVDPPDGLRIVVSSRIGKPLPSVLQEDHPLRDADSPAVQLLSLEPGAKEHHSRDAELSRQVRSEIAAGDLDRAEQTARSLGEPFRGDALVRVVAGLVDAGRIDRAASVGDSLLGPARDEAMVAVVGAWADCGAVSRAELLARSLADPFRSDALIRVVAGWLSAGDLDRAEELIGRLDEPYRSDAMVLVVSALARIRQAARAESAASSLPRPAHDEAMVAVVGAWADNGDLLHAEAIARRLEKPFGSVALVRVVGALTAAGDLHRGEQIAAALDEPFRAEALVHVVTALAGTGHVERAESIARSLPGPSRDEALVAIISALAEAGDVYRAEALCRDLRPPARDQALVLVVTAMADAGLMVLAEQVVSSIADPARREQATAVITAQGAVDRARTALTSSSSAAGDTWRIVDPPSGGARGRVEMSDLARMASDGNRKALGDLLNRVRRVAYAYVRSRLWTHAGSPDMLDEVTQAICMAVFGALGRYRGDGRSFESFVYTTASRKVADAQRSFAIAEIATPNVPDIEQPAPSGADQEPTTAEMTDVMIAIDRLPERLREILRLRVVAGMSAEETARALEMTPATVRTAQHKALNQLRGALRTDPRPPQ
ncbi:sigma-70 family RNA polymerase sigma factor [Kribbella sp. NPDC050124]|uniref:sigma-70 family RNA polymerase sigma factor n=1 Tax=Kribbella sp. NPDC050124 TaxID=3364114 RepID=UPI00378971F4